MPNQTEDYYRILNVTQDAPAEEIKKAYRKLALETHPDRNPGDASAEERFKKVSEAYGVLGDVQKRAQYDEYRRLGVHYRPGGTAGGTGFGYSQDEIFRGFYGSRNAQDIFAEFQRMGLRFDEDFIRNIFFGNRNVYFQGMFSGGPQGVRFYRASWQPGQGSAQNGGQAVRKPEKPKGLVQAGLSLIADAGKKVGEWVLKKALNSAAKRMGGDGLRQTGSGGGPGGDVTYQIAVSSADALNGVTVEYELPHMENRPRVSVRIPPGIQNGTRLRLREMGRLGRRGNRGDLYFQVRVN